MPAYKIIGGDQQVYGPVSGEQLREWISQGRANGQTLAQAEGGSEWRPLSSFPEFADVLSTQPPPPRSQEPDAEALAAQIKARDYDLDIGRCLSRSWELLKEHFWLLAGATALAVLAVAILNELISLFTRPAMTALFRREITARSVLIVFAGSTLGSIIYTLVSAGLCLLLLKLIRGQPARVVDASAGFGSAAGQLVLAGLVTSVLTTLGFLACLLPGLYLSIAWVFTVPVIIDRKIGFWAAMELSRKVVTQHWWLVFCLVVVVGVITFIGLLACCIGLLASMPLALGALLYAYEDIFGASTTAAA
ncbi:MAG: DUF4339 domain-containing protein [Chloroflexi bacterium]|nr:DUF4339 domain-containing protein [Chloroflexota bacterium]